MQLPLLDTYYWYILVKPNITTMITRHGSAFIHARCTCWAGIEGINPCDCEWSTCYAMRAQKRGTASTKLRSRRCTVFFAAFNLGSVFSQPSVRWGFASCPRGSPVTATQCTLPNAPLEVLTMRVVEGGATSSSFFLFVWHISCADLAFRYSLTQRRLDCHLFFRFVIFGEHIHTHVCRKYPRLREIIKHPLRERVNDRVRWHTLNEIYAK